MCDWKDNRILNKMKIYSDEKKLSKEFKKFLAREFLILLLLTFMALVLQFVVPFAVKNYSHKKNKEIGDESWVLKKGTKDTYVFDRSLYDTRMSNKNKIVSFISSIKVTHFLVGIYVMRILVYLTFWAVKTLKD